MLPIALQHGMELWWDGSTPTKRLDRRGDASQFTRFVNARIEGKLSEVAFSMLLDDVFDVQSRVDWRIYGDYETTDDGDLECLISGDEEYTLGTDLDIKKTKPWNQWLAIRTEIFESFSDTAPVLLTKSRIESDIDVDPWENADGWDDVDTDDEFRTRLLSFADAEFPLQVSFVGSAYPTEFTDYFDEGDRLYDPDTGADLGDDLRRPNRGIHVSNLRASPQRWNRIVYQLIAHTDIDWTPLTALSPSPV